MATRRAARGWRPPLKYEDPAGCFLMGAVFVAIGFVLVGIITFLPTYRTLDVTKLPASVPIVNASAISSAGRRPRPAPVPPGPSSPPQPPPQTASVASLRTLDARIVDSTDTPSFFTTDACLGDDSGQTRLLFARADGASSLVGPLPGTGTVLAVSERGQWADRATGASALVMMRVGSPATTTTLLAATRCGGDVSSQAFDRVSGPRILAMPAAGRLLIVARAVRLPSLIEGRIAQTDALISMVAALAADGVSSSWPPAPTVIGAGERVESLVAVGIDTALLLTSTDTQLHLWRFHAGTAQWDATPTVLATNLPATRGPGETRGAALVPSALPSTPATWYAGYQTDDGAWTIAASSADGGATWTTPVSVARGFRNFRPNPAIAANSAGSYATWETSAFDTTFVSPASDIAAWTTPATGAVPVNRTARLMSGLGAPRVVAGGPGGQLYAVGAHADPLRPGARSLLVSQRSCSSADVRSTCSSATLETGGCTAQPTALASACRRVAAPWDQATLAVSRDDGMTSSLVASLAGTDAGVQTVASAIALGSRNALVAVAYESVSGPNVTMTLAFFDSTTLARVGTVPIALYDMHKAARLNGASAGAAMSLVAAPTGGEYWLSYTAPPPPPTSAQPDSATGVPSNSGLVADMTPRGQLTILRIRVAVA